MLAWTGAESGHWVVRTAAVDLNGVRSIDTISAPGRNALLAEPRPRAGRRGLCAVERTATELLLLLLRAGPQRPGGVCRPRGGRLSGPDNFHRPPADIRAGRSGSTGEAAIAVDPDSDRAIAAWRTPGGAIDYSLRALGGS